MFLVVLTCVAPRFRRLTLPTYPADFNVYYCAAQLVRHGQASALYTGADTGADPQKAPAPWGSPISRAAEAQHLPFVGLYVYPPILADLLIPFTSVSLATATPLWLATNGVFLLLTAFLVVRLLRLPVLSWRAALIFLVLACFTPALQCLVDGQITILLLLLWAAGMVFYQEEHELSAGAVFALAAAIKLTPGIVLIPFLLWKRWRVAYAFLGSLAALTLFCLVVDTPHALHVFLTRVAPAMSGAIPNYTNYSLPAATQRLVTLLRTGGVPAYPQNLPASTVLLGRMSSVVTFAALLALMVRTARNLSRAQQVMTLGLLSLMAPVLSPVSWFHAYATAFLAFVVLWQDAFRRRIGAAYLVALTAVTLLLGSAVSENLMSWLVLASEHAGLASALQIGQLIAATTVVFVQLWRMKPSRPQLDADLPKAGPALARHLHA